MVKAPPFSKARCQLADGEIILRAIITEGRTNTMTDGPRLNLPVRQRRAPLYAKEWS